MVSNTLPLCNSAPGHWLGSTGMIPLTHLHNDLRLCHSQHLDNL